MAYVVGWTERPVGFTVVRGALTLTGLACSVLWLCLPHHVAIAGVAIAAYGLGSLLLVVRLRHAANHDALTGMVNRARFASLLNLGLSEPRDEPLAVVCIGLDNFSRVNDSLGHTVGDALLVEVARRLREHAAASVTLAHFGGADFAAAIRADAWEIVAQSLQQALGAPFAVGEHELTISASLGIALAQPGEDVQTVICHAETALHRAKREGVGRLVRFDSSMRATVAERLLLENDLRGALDRDELQVAFQPVVRLADGAIIGAEALARWTHPELGPISPEVFIGVAEETGMIDALGDQVLAAAARAAVRWTGILPRFRVSVNLSPRQLERSDLLPRIERILAAAGLASCHLNLEVTESSVLSQDARTRANLEGIARSDVRLALDDFGTGHSSLAQLSRVPFDVLKLDRHFIGAESTPIGDAIIAAVTQIGVKTGIHVLAEGIETAAHRDRVRELGCCLGQGWYFGPPMSAFDFGLLLDAQSSASSMKPSAVAREMASAREFTPSLR